MRAALICLTLLCWSCQTKENWSYEAVKNRLSKHGMARLVYPADTPTKGIELEIVRHGESLKGYLNLEQFSFPSLEENSQKTEVLINQTPFVFDRLAGGQRLTLSEESLDFIVESLTSGKNVTISVAHFFQEIPSRAFTSRMEKLLQKPIVFLPDEWIHFEI